MTRPIAMNLIGLAAALALGCNPGPAKLAGPVAAAAPTRPTLDTAELMVKLHQHHDKLGYAIAAGNQPLARFYLQKVREVLVEADDLEPLEGLPVSTMVPTMMASSMGVLGPQVDQADWERARDTYRGMTMACNSCHAATRREFIVILPAEGKPPYSQQF